MFELTPYRSPYTQTLATLVGGADRARANAMRQSGAAVAQGVQDVGQTVGATLNNFVRLKLDEPRRQMTDMQLAQEKRAEADDLAARDAFKTAGGDPSKALDLLEEKGNYPVAMKLRGQLNQQRIQDLDLMGKTLDNTHKRLEQGSQLVQGVLDSPDPASAWTAVVPRLRALVGPELGAKVPDTYDPAVAQQALRWGMKASDVIRMRKDAAQAALAGLQSAVTKTDLTKKLTDATAKYAISVESPEEWASARTQIKNLGGDVAADVLAQFPETFSPELATKARTLLQAGQATHYQHETVLYTDAKGKAHISEAGFDQTKNQWFLPGSTTPLANVRKFERTPEGEMDWNGLAQAVLANPEAYHDISETAKTRIWPALNQAGFRPPPKTDRGASGATAERWRMNALANLDKDFRASKLAGPNDPTAMTQAEYDTRKAAIETSYKLQLGAGAPPQPGAPTKPPQGPPVPPKKKTAATPQDLLKGQKAGKYTLTDGSKWIVGTDGTVTAAPK